MSTPLSEQRTPLTYPPPASTRFLIFLSSSVLCYVYIRWAPESWSHPADEHLNAQGVMPFAWWLMLPLSAIFVFFLLAIVEGLFLLGRKINKLKLEFDSVNLYITKDDDERVVPLKEIVSLRLVYGKGFFDSSRMPLYRYAIGTGDADNPEEVVFTVFVKTRRNFSRFRKLVEQVNPGLRQSNFATSLDGLIRWFRRRNS